MRKMQAIVDFCSECKNLLKAFNVESSLHDGQLLNLHLQHTLY